MAGREVREYTNLTDPKDKKWGKGKDKIDEEDITFQRMVAKMQEVAGERGGYLHGRGALDSDDLLYLKEQMEAEEDAERLLRRTEKRAFAAFKKAANLADSSPASVPLPLRVEPKPKSGIRQQDLLKRVVEVKPKKPRISHGSERNIPSPASNNVSGYSKSEADKYKNGQTIQDKNGQTMLQSSKPGDAKAENSEKKSDENPAKSLLGLAYGSSEEDED